MKNKLQKENMSSTGLDVFDTTIEKTNQILKEIEIEMGWEGRRNQSYLALRTILHALRDRLPLEEAVHFSAQLPLILKGTFFDGWNIMEVPVKMNKEEFIRYIGERFRFDVEGDIEGLIKRVGLILFSHVDEPEANKILSEFPADIASLFCGD